MKVKFHLGIRINNAYQEEIVEIPDDYSENDIENWYQEWAGNYIDGCWTIIE